MYVLLVFSFLLLSTLTALLHQLKSIYVYVCVYVCMYVCNSSQFNSL